MFHTRLRSSRCEKLISKGSFAWTLIEQFATSISATIVQSEPLTSSLFIPVLVVNDRLFTLQFDLFSNPPTSFLHVWCCKKRVSLICPFKYTVFDLFLSRCLNTVVLS